MTKTFFALGAAAVALTAMPAMQANARHYSNQVRCTRWHNDRCVSWNRMTRGEARREAEYRVGYSFGPSFGYTDVAALPQPFVTRYRLHNNFRYVNQDGYVYVVNPNTYRVVRILPNY
jgi:hypothetical protein